MITPKVPVAKEGVPFIGCAAFFTIVLALIDCTTGAIIGLILSTFTLAFFRDPERFTPVEDNILVSPADGKVIVVDEVDDQEFLGQKCQKVSIFMNVFNVHVNRLPCSGTIDKIQYKPGKFYSADSKKGGLENESCGTLLTTETGQKIAVVQIAGLIARRIICWLEPGDKGRTGSRFGLIRFGSRVDLYLPTNTRIKTKVGDKVKAGESILGYLQQDSDR